MFKIFNSTKIYCISYILLSLTGCYKNKIDFQNQFEIGTGMPSSEIVKILGKPTSIAINNNMQQWLYDRVVVQKVSYNEDGFLSITLPQEPLENLQAISIMIKFDQQNLVYAYAYYHLNY